VIRSVSSKKDWDTARALLEEYLRLPDSWPKHRVPASLPASMSDYLDGFPSPACQAPHGIVLVAGPDQVRPESRNRGLGRELLAEAMHRAHGALCRRIRLDVLSTRCPPSSWWV
jgi:GNAT superfamily N-acetyltransferase